MSAIKLSRPAVRLSTRLSTARKKTDEAPTIESLTPLIKILGNIAHDLRTPLSTINLGINSIKKIEEYIHPVLENDEPIQAKHMEKLKQLPWVCENIKFAIQSALLVLELTLANTNPTQAKLADTNQMSMLTSINYALKHYPLSKNQRRLVHVDQQTDFYYLGNQMLTNQLIYSLLKNALYAIRANDDKGELFIHLETHGAQNHLIFRDTATGIEDKLLAKIFDPLVSSRPTANGLGLYLCKTIMQAYHGKISCQSKLGEYTAFTLSFPKSL